MGRWHELKRGESSTVGDLSALRAYSFFIPSKTDLFVRMLLDRHVRNHSFETAHDLVKFIDDFVLSERVALQSDVMDVVAPYFVDHYSAATLPLIMVGSEITSTMAGEAKRLVGDAESSTVPSEQRRLLRESAIVDGVALWLHSVSEDKFDDISAYIVSTLKLHEPMAVPADNSPEWAKAIRPPDALAFVFRRMGIHASPGLRFATAFQQDALGGAGRVLYDDMSSSLNESFRRVAAAEGVRHITIPPLAAILFDRSSDRASLVRNLVDLREEFAPLRTEMRSLQARVAEAPNLRAKLDVIAELDAASAALLKKSHPATRPSLVRRVWDVVKGITPTAIGRALGDALLQWDANRVAVSSVRSFVHLQELVMDLRVNAPRIERVFGAIEDR